MVTAERLREVLDYNPENGNLTWKGKRRRVHSGRVAGCLDRKTGYRLIGIDGVLYKSHRLVWLWCHGEWPKGEVDHISLDKNDNRLGNLRDATSSQNNSNIAIRSNNKSGLKGASWHNRVCKWWSQIQSNGTVIHLGYFETAEEAHIAYVAAAHKYHGEFAREA